MKKNNEYMVKELKEATNYEEKDVYAILQVLDEHFIIGHNNKEKIVNDFIKVLNISDEEADELYNTCASIIVKGIFK